MTRHHELGHHFALGTLAAGTTWVALAAWGPFLAVPGEFLGPLAVMALVLAMLGALLRSYRTPTAVTLGLQAVVATSMVCRHLADSFIPDPTNLAVAAHEVGVALDSAREYAAPVGPDVPSIAPLLIVGGLLLVLLVDFLACGLQRVPLAGLALLAIYSVPAGIPAAGSAWLSFLVAAAGFLAMLHLDARHRLQRWGRALGPHAGNAELDVNPISEAVRAGAGRIGVAAIGLAFVTPMVVPVMDLDVLGIGQGSGAGDIRIRQPIADMRRDLQRPQDFPVVNVVTDDPTPGYLRIAVLNRYNGGEWTPGDRHGLTSAAPGSGELPAPQGVVPSVPRRTWDYEVHIHEEFDSTWLPTQFPAAAVGVTSDWKFDPETMDFLATGDQTTAGMSYAMTAIDYDYGANGSLFRDSDTDSVAPKFLELPDQTPASIFTWARNVTAAGSTHYERATLLQRWFRSEFEYSLSRAPEGAGNQTLERFLEPGGRVGYCEQFASAMAVMARALDIPSRVAVGFLRPTRQPDGSWTYSTHDLHAWPELYFSQIGWVRFEPTPAGRAAGVPPYTRVPSAVGAPGQGPNASPQPDPTAEPGQQAPATAAPTEPGPTAEDAGEGDGGGVGTTTIVLVSALVLALLAMVLVSPRLLRLRQRERRLDGGPDDVWEELRAAAIDLGLPWPEGRSPREVGAALSAYTTDPQTAAALDRLVQAVETTRYARPGDRSASDAALPVAFRRCRTALEARVTSRDRRRARWLPRSLWRAQADESEPLREPARLG